MNQNKHATRWLAHINSIIATTKNGEYQAHDNQGKPITIEWHITPMMTPEYVALSAAVADLGVAFFTEVEMQFLRAFPESVATEPIFESLKSFFKDGIRAVDWQEVEKKIREVIKSYFIYTFTITDEIIKSYSDRIVCFVMVKDSQTNELLGYITYLVQPDCSYGMVKTTGIGVKPEVQKRGLGKLLMHSIFKIIPEVKHIYLCTRITNTAALATYSAWGFVRIDPAPGSEYMYDSRYWVFMKYEV